MSTNPPLPSLTLDPRMSLRNHAFRSFLRLAGWALFDIKVEGKENIPAGNCIIVSNHLSWIDHLLLMTILPTKPRPFLLGAAQSLNSPFKEWLLHNLGGVILVERGANWIGKSAVQLPLQVLESGCSLLLFPEGDVSLEEGKLLPLKRGIGHFVLRLKCPILPIALSGVKELYWRKRMRVIIGMPFAVQADGRDRRAAIDAAVEQVDTALRALLPPYSEPSVRKKRLLFLNKLSDNL